ncbi:MAG TPA: hypothetical protein VML91_05085 [Burkholderiales bacterium]|nr:hypothetical protein [Burkholderiales bacterium]
MRQGSKFVVAAVAVGALGAATAAFAHPGERAGGGEQGAADTPMHTAMQQGENRIGPSGRGVMAHRGMGQGMQRGPTQNTPEEEHKH